MKHRLQRHAHGRSGAGEFQTTLYADGIGAASVDLESVPVAPAARLAWSRTSPRASQA